MSVAAIFESMEYGPAPESDAQARAWLDEHGRAFGLFIGGEWVEAASGESFETTNPATGDALARIAQAGAGDVDAAVAAARKAQPGWNKLGGHGRARHLYALARLVQKHSRLFAVLESMDNGKPVRESRDIDVPLVARHFYHHAGWAQLMESEFAGYGPVGVAGQIIPWNFPLLMLAWKVAPALAMGNTAGLEGRAGAGHGQYVSAQTRRIHQPDRAAVRRDLPRGGLAERRGQYRHRRRARG
jgi:aldehyde dehydrogenase (NAD+)